MEYKISLTVQIFVILASVYDVEWFQNHDATVFFFFLMKTFCTISLKKKMPFFRFCHHRKHMEISFHKIQFVVGVPQGSILGSLSFLLFMYK